MSRRWGRSSRPAVHFLSSSIRSCCSHYPKPIEVDVLPRKSYLVAYLSRKYYCLVLSPVDTTSSFLHLLNLWASYFLSLMRRLQVVRVTMIVPWPTIASCSDFQAMYIFSSTISETYSSKQANFCNYGILNYVLRYSKCWQSRPIFRAGGLVIKLDFTLLPYFPLIWFLFGINRASYSTAYISGMQEALGFVGKDYNYMNTIYLVTYAVFQIPSTSLLTVWPPKYIFVAANVTWSIMTLITFRIEHIWQIWLLNALEGAFSAIA